MPAHLDSYKFNRLPAEEQRALASAGGQAAHAQGKAHEFTPEEARTAGREGGLSVSRDKEHMREIGRRGGRAPKKGKIVKERPILFSAPMVRALLSGAKTQTRRIVKNGPVAQETGRWTFTVSSTDRSAVGQFCYGMLDDCGQTFTERGRERVTFRGKCPYGESGDRLIVKEAAWVWCQKERDGETKTGRPKFNYIPKGRFVHYQADEQKPTYRVNESPDQGWRLKIGRYLPRWASRITLEVASIRVERLQDISEEDARAEGAQKAVASLSPEGEVRVIQIDGCGAYREGFAALWCQINGVESWDANPYVWVVSFKRVEATP